MKNSYSTSLLILALLLFTQSGFVTANNRLWLPIAYKKHYTKLIEASKKVNNLPRCYQILNGTLSEEKTNDKNIVFVFRCRSLERHVSVVYVDEKNFGISYHADVWKRQEEEEKQEKLRQMLAIRDQYWAVCEAVFREKTANFNSPEIMTNLPPRPEIIDNSGFIYRIEFKTLSLKKRDLKYMATATIMNLGKCQVDIRPI